MGSGSTHRFEDLVSDADEDNLNSIDMGGNVYQDAGLTGLNVGVTAIRGLMNGAELVYAGVASQALTASQTNYMYLNSAGVLTISTSAYPTYGTDSGEDLYYPLATVVCDGSSVTSITDTRWRFNA